MRIEDITQMWQHMIVVGLLLVINNSLIFQWTLVYTGANVYSTTVNLPVAMKAVIAGFCTQRGVSNTNTGAELIQPYTTSCFIKSAVAWFTAGILIIGTY